MLVHFSVEYIPICGDVYRMCACFGVTAQHPTFLGELMYRSGYDTVGIELYSTYSCTSLEAREAILILCVLYVPHRHAQFSNGEWRLAVQWCSSKPELHGRVPVRILGF